MMMMMMTITDFMEQSPACEANTPTVIHEIPCI